MEKGAEFQEFHKEFYNALRIKKRTSKKYDKGEFERAMELKPEFEKLNTYDEKLDFWEKNDLSAMDFCDNDDNVIMGIYPANDTEKEKLNKWQLRKALEIREYVNEKNLNDFKKDINKKLANRTPDLQYEMLVNVLKELNKKNELLVFEVGTFEEIYKTYQFYKNNGLPQKIRDIYFHESNTTEDKILFIIKRKLLLQGEIDFVHDLLNKIEAKRIYKRDNKQVINIQTSKAMELLENNYKYDFFEVFDSEISSCNYWEPVFENGNDEPVGIETDYKSIFEALSKLSVGFIYEIESNYINIQDISIATNYIRNIRKDLDNLLNSNDLWIIEILNNTPCKSEFDKVYDKVSSMLEESETFKDKIKWKGNTARFVYLFKELAAKGWIETPTKYDKSINQRQFMKLLLNHFFIPHKTKENEEATLEHLVTEYSSESIVKYTEGIFQIKTNK